MHLLIPKHRHFIDGDTIYWDTETTGRLSWRGDKPFAFSFCNDAGVERYFEFPVNPLTREPIPDPKILEVMRRLLEDESIRKVGFNVKFDVQMMDVGYGIKTRGRIEDVMWMSHVCNSAEIRHGLKPLCDKYGISDKEDEERLGMAVKACRRQVRKLGWKIATEETGDTDDKAYKADYWLPVAVAREAPAKVRSPLLEAYPDLATVNQVYASKDAYRTGALYNCYEPIMEEEGLWPVYEREMRLAPIIYRTEEVGVRIFANRCEDLSKQCRERMTALRAELTTVFGDFAIKVPDNRIRKYLFTSKAQGGQGLPVLAKTEKGRKFTGADAWQGASVAKEVLNLYAETVPVVKQLQNFAKHKKVLHDYVGKYVAHARNEAGQLVIHANFRQIGAKTGRMACADPPLQQTPKRAEEGDIMKRVRYPFGPKKNCLWVHYDYKSIEPRVLGEESGETDIIRIFNEGQASAYTKSGWTNDPYEVLVERVCVATGWTREYLEDLLEERGGARQVCKNNFLGWTYGEGVRKLAAQMGTSLEIAAQIIDALKMAFSGVGPFMVHMQDVARKDGCIWNRYGRKLMIPPPGWAFDEELMVWRRIEWWYKATNYLIQSTAADMLKEAAIRLGAPEFRFDWDRSKRGVVRVAQPKGYLRGTGCEIVMYVHDELIIEMPTKLALTNEKFVRGIGDVMADNCGMFKKLKTPVDAKVTWSAWSDPEEVESLWN